MAEVEGAFTLLFSFLVNVSEDFQYARLVNELAEALATVNGGGGDGAPTASPELRLRILASLYNLVETRGGAKLRTLQQIVRFASETRQMAKLDAFLTSVSSLPSQWALTPVESRELFLTVANALSRSGDQCVLCPAPVRGSAVSSSC